jgi:hypothetical protein
VAKAVGEPMRGALARRLEKAIAAVASRELGDHGLALGELAEVLREAIGEASDPFLGSLADGVEVPTWLGRVRRAAQLAHVAIGALAWLPDYGGASRMALSGDEGIAYTCEVGAAAFVLADRALADAVEAGPGSTLDAEIALERARMSIRTVWACLRLLVVQRHGADRSGAVNGASEVQMAGRALAGGPGRCTRGAVGAAA